MTSKPLFNVRALIVGSLFFIVINTFGGNLLVNGGFNALGFPYSGDFTAILAPWHWSGSLAYSWANDRATVGPGVTLDPGGIVGFSGGSIYQDVVTTPGQSYEITITAHSRAGLPGSWLEGLWNGTSLTPQLAQYFEWTAITYDVQAISTTSRLTIMAVPDNGPIWVDSVNLVPVPEPTSFALIGFGGSLLLFRKTQIRAIRNQGLLR